jgi:hypothetical protein
MIIDSKLIWFSSLHVLAEMHVGNRQGKKCDRNRDPKKVSHERSPETKFSVPTTMNWELPGFRMRVLGYGIDESKRLGRSPSARQCSAPIPLDIKVRKARIKGS